MKCRDAESNVVFLWTTLVGRSWPGCFAERFVCAFVCVFVSLRLFCCFVSCCFLLFRVVSFCFVMFHAVARSDPPPGILLDDDCWNSSF